MKKRDLSTGGEPRPSEILEAIYDFSMDMENRFINLESRFDRLGNDMDIRFDRVHRDISQIRDTLDNVAYKSEVKDLSGRVDRLEGLVIK